MDFKIRFDKDFNPNGEKKKVFMGSLKQHTNAVDRIVVEFENLPVGFVPFLNIERYTTSATLIDSTPPLVAFKSESGKAVKVITNWFTEIVGYFECSVTLLGTNVEIDGQMTTPRIETGRFWFAVERSLESDGEAIEIPSAIDLQYKVDKDLGLYVDAEIGNEAYIYVDDGGDAVRVKLETNSIETDKVLITKGAILKALDDLLIYTDEEIIDAINYADSQITAHDLDGDAHTDIRNLIQALQGAFVYQGTIPISEPTGTQLSARIVELHGRTAIKGDVLVDADKNEWYYNGTTWDNYGQFIIGMASNTTDGLMSRDDFKKLRQLYTRQALDLVLETKADKSEFNAFRDDVNVVLEAISTGGYRELVTNTITTMINETLVIGREATYTQIPTSLTINFPSGIKHGYFAALNFRTGTNVFPINLINHSSYALKIMKHNQELENLQVGVNKVVNLTTYCDGFYLYVYYKEV